MKKYGLPALVLVLGITFCSALPLTARAQSPWESGGFKGYDQQPGTPDLPSEDGPVGEGGLQGFSLFPNTSAPVAPTLGAAPAIGPATAPELQSSFLSPAPLPVAPEPAPVALSSDTNAQFKSIMAQVADPTFAVLAQQSVSAIVQASQLAEKNATSDMQPFAEKLISIYGGMQNELAELIQKANVFTPVDLNIPNGVDRLKDKSGTDFNKQYTQVLMQKFNMLQSAFKKEAEGGQNADLKAYAASHLDMLNQQKTAMDKSFASTLSQGGMPPGTTR